MIKQLQKYSPDFQEAYKMLDSYQKKVIEYNIPIKSYLGIEAGAGSGKSTTMTIEAQKYIEEGLYPRDIIMTTFSKNSVIDLQHKYKKLFPKQVLQPVITTLHSLALNILRDNFSEYSDYKIKASGYGLLAGVLKDLGFLEENVLAPEKHGMFIMQMLEHIEAYQCLNISSPYDVDTSIDIFDYVKNPSNLFKLSEFYEVMEAYTDIKIEAKNLTFSDMAYLCYWELKENPKVLARVQKKIKLLICDETQDMDTLQFDLIQLLTVGNCKVVAVYDTLQTIYKFRYATPERLTAWSKDGVFNNATILPLLMNYRSDANIVKASNYLRRFGGYQESVPFKDTKGRGAIEIRTCYLNILEGNEVVETVKSLVQEQGYRYGDIAVIIRTNKFLKEIVEPAVIKADIPYKMLNDSTGAKLLDRELSDYLFNALSLYIDSDDKVALVSILAMLFKDTHTIELENLAKVFQDNVSEYIPDILRGREDFISEVANQIWLSITQEFDSRPLMIELLKHFDFVLAEVIRLNKVELKIRKESVRVINSIVNMVSQLASDKKETALDNLIKITLEVTETYEKDTTEDFLHIGSIHSTKGKEFPVTISVGFTSAKEVADPDGDNLEKFYVQSTRAIEKSIFISSLTYQGFGDETKILDDSGFKDAVHLTIFKDYVQNCQLKGICNKLGMKI